MVTNMRTHTIEKYKSSFGLVAKEYKKYRGSYNDTLYALLFELANHTAEGPLSILDLGCGVGNSTEPIATMAKKLHIPLALTGCDIDERMLKQARLSAKKNKLPIAYMQGQAENIPFENETFDMVISGAAFHWFATKRAMKDVQRVLKPKGIYMVFWTQNVGDKNTLIGQDLYKTYKWQGIPRDLRDPKRVKDIFTQSGFKKVTLKNIPHSETRTMTETLGLIKTNSSYALLSASDKKIFMREMTKAYREALGKKNDTVWQEFHVCYGMRPL